MRATLPSRNQDLSGKVFLWFISIRQHLFLSFFVCFGYYLGAQISLAFQITASSISIIWIPISILLAALLLSPVRFWWLIFAAVFPAHYLVQFQSGAPAWIILWSYFVNCALSFTTAALLRKFTGTRFKFDSSQQVALYLLAIGLAPAVTAFAGAGLLQFTEQNSNYLLSWEQLFLSNAVAFLTIVPAIVSTVDESTDFFKKIARERSVEAMFFVFGLAAALFLAFQARNLNLGDYPASVFIPFPFLLWSALRFGRCISTTVVLGVTLFSVWSFVHTTKILTGDVSAHVFLDLQLGLIFISVVPLILSVQIAESRNHELPVEENEFSNGFNFDEQLNENEPMNSSILKALPDLAFLISDDGTYLDYHARNKSDLYLPPEEFLGKNLREIMPPHIAEQVFGYFKAAKETGETQCFEYSLEINGVEKTFECRIVQSGKDKFLSIVRDVTEQKQTQKALVESKQMFEAQYRNLPIPSYIWRKSDDDFVLIDYNHAANAVKNGKAANLLGVKAGDEYYDYPVIFEGFKRCFDEKRTVELEMLYQPSPYAEERYVFLTYVFLPPDLVMFHIQDLTERKRTLDELEDKFAELQAAKEEIALQNDELRLSRAEIEEEKERYRELFDSAPDGLLVTDSKGGILEVNETAAVLLVEKQGILKGFPIATFVAFEDREIFEKLLAKMQVRKNVSKNEKNRKAVYEIEISMIANNRKFQAAVKVSPVFNKGELNLRWMVRDITEKRIIQAKLRKSEELYRNVVETQTELICRYLPDSTLTFVNDAYCRFFGKSREELIGTKFFEYIPEDVLPAIKLVMESLVKNRKSVTVEHEVIQTDGSIGWQQWVDHVIEDEQGNIIELQGIGRDITAQKHAIERLRESEERFYSFMTNSPVSAWIDDEDGQILYLNSTYHKSIKLPDGDNIGKSLYDVFPPEVADEYHKIIKDVLESESPNKFIADIVRTDNSTGKFLSYCFPLTSSIEGKRLVGGFAIDITEQQFFEKALSESEEKYRRIVDTMLEGIWITNTDMRISFANQRLGEMLGYKQEELLGQNIFDFYDEETRLLSQQIINRRRSGISERYDAKLRRKDGSYLWVIVSATPYYDLNGEYAGSLTMISDITERKQAEDNVREREAMLRGVIQNIPDGAVAILDRDFRYLMAEGEVFEKLGLSDELLIGTHIWDLYPKETVDHVLPFFKRAFEGEEIGFETDISGQFYETYVLPLRDQKENIYAIFVVARNITEHKQREEKLQQLSARLLTIQDEERRRLARELHDETAQNLAVLGINLSAVKKMLSPEEEKALDLLRDSESLILRSLREVRTLSYLLHPPMLDDGGLVSALKWFINGFAARSGIEVAFLQPEEFGRLPKDVETALYRIVQEGLNNIHRHSGSPTASIELIKEAQRIILRVKDEGCGLPAAVADEAAGGEFRLLGVGLPGMRERLRLLGGQLEISSNKKGTTLTASVPLEANSHD